MDERMNGETDERMNGRMNDDDDDAGADVDDDDDDDDDGADGHFTGAILCGNKQEKCRMRRLPPQLLLY